MSALGELAECKAKCPNCDEEFPGNEPSPGCNECQCCFCSENCRTEFHLLGKMEHDYNAPMEEEA